MNGGAICFLDMVGVSYVSRLLSDEMAEVLILTFSLMFNFFSSNVSSATPNLGKRRNLKRGD